MNLISVRSKSLILLCLVVLSSTQQVDKAENQSIIQEYNARICAGTNSCDLVEKVPSKYRTLRVRNCMCDERCSIYDDCCDDAKRTNTRQYISDKFNCINTTFDGGVYMITSCPASWSESAKIKENCQTQNTTLLQIDVLLTTPVTSNKKQVTYRNLFCALCHGENEFEFWSIGFSYEAFPFIKSSNNEMSRPNSSHTTDPGEISTNSSTSLAYSGVISQIPPEPQPRELLKNMSLNEDNAEFLFWISTVNNSSYKCFLNPVVPESLANLVRFCEPSVIDKCSASGGIATTTAECSGSTLYTYVGDHLVYKNPSCLACNRNISSIKNTSYCPQFPQKADAKLFTEMHINSRYIPKIDHCSHMSKANSAYTLFCQVMKRQGTAGAKTYCKPSINKVTGMPCQFARYFPNTDVEFLDNETIYLKPFNTKYPKEEWIKNPSNPNETFICGSYVTGWCQMQRIMEEWISNVLVKISLVCLILQLIVFQQVPLMQNLSGKCLAAFCAVLLATLFCLELGPRLPSCVITAVIQHFALLSCFTWMLIMSFDCWLSLYRATSQLRSTTGKQTSKFITYCTISLIVPLIIVGVSLYVELTPANSSDMCKYKAHYGISKDCFIFSKTALFTFFVIPATAMFIVNISFFIHAIYMIYRTHKNTVNPNTRRDFLVYTRLALLMGLTWTLGSIANVTESCVADFLFSVMNASQGIFIFFGFTFKKKYLKVLLKKHENNRFLSGLLSPLVKKEPSCTGTVLSELPSKSEAV